MGWWPEAHSTDIISQYVISAKESTQPGQVAIARPRVVHKVTKAGNKIIDKKLSTLIQLKKIVLHLCHLRIERAKYFVREGLKCCVGERSAKETSCASN